MDPASAVKQAAARHGMVLTDQAAQDIAAAALTAHDGKVYVEQAFAHEIWEQEAHREHLRRQMRRGLLAEVADRQALPVSAPEEMVSARPLGAGLWPGHPDAILVTLSVPVRTQQATPVEEAASIV